MRRNIARDELGTQELDRKWIRVVAVRRRHRRPITMLVRSLKGFGRQEHHRMFLHLPSCLRIKMDPDDVATIGHP